jgi:hypothetical protein
MKLIEYNRDELRIERTAIINVIVYKAAFPSDPESFPGLLLAHDTPMIRLSANHQNELRLSDFLIHPKGPTLRGRGFILIQDAIDPFGAEPV